MKTLIVTTDDGEYTHHITFEVSPTIVPVLLSGRLELGEVNVDFGMPIEKIVYDGLQVYPAPLPKKQKGSKSAPAKVARVAIDLQRKVFAEDNTTLFVEKVTRIVDFKNLSFSNEDGVALLDAVTAFVNTQIGWICSGYRPADKADNK